MNNRTEELAKKQMSDRIMEVCRHMNCSHVISHAILENGEMNKVFTDMEYYIERKNSGLLWGQNDLPGGLQPTRNNMIKIIKDMKKNLKGNSNTIAKNKKSYFVDVFKRWWVEITYVQARNFIAKQSKDVLADIYDAYYPVELRVKDRRVIKYRLELVNMIGKEISKLSRKLEKKRQEDFVKAVLLIKGKNRGKEILNVFNNHLFKNKETIEKTIGEEKKKKLRNLLKKAGESNGRTGFTYKNYQIEGMLNNIKKIKNTKSSKRNV